MGVKIRGADGAPTHRRGVEDLLDLGEDVSFRVGKAFCGETALDDDLDVS
jgi:hypothetical protein